MEKTFKSGVVQKTFDVIKAFVDIQPEWGVRDLSRQLQFPASTLHRFLQQLQDEGILEFNESTGKYRIGVELIRIGSVVSSNLDLIKIAKTYMQQLVDKHKETVCLVMYHKKLHKIVFVEKIQGPHPLQYLINLGEFQPIPYGSSGKSILAFLEPDEIEDILNHENLIGEQAEEVRKEIKQIRASGYSMTRNQRIEGSQGIAAPILNAENKPIGSLLYTVPVSRFQPGKEKEIAADVRHAAFTVSQILGHRGGGKSNEV